MRISDNYDEMVKYITDPKMGISEALWECIKEHLKPGMRTLEFGSGISTLLFQAMRCNHEAVEHNKEYGERWGECVNICPLVGKPLWYDWRPPNDLENDPYDFILIDGPQRKIGRKPVKKFLKDIIFPKTVVIVDDTHTLAEKKLAKFISKNFNKDRKVNKKWTILTPRQVK